MESDAQLKLAIVVPCYNEQEVLPETSSQLLELLDRLVESGKIAPESSLYFVDDGSHDETWRMIRQLVIDHTRVRGIRLSGNCGHQYALLAGLHTTQGDAIISIDADLQDDIGVIEEMVDEFREGSDIVYGVRKDRTSDPFFKRFTAEMYYMVLKFLGVDIVSNHADYRLMSRRVIDALKQYEEINLFLRGIVPTIGFRSSTVEYERKERFAGESKYPLRKMLGLAIDGVTSFSAVPLRFIAGFGIFVFFVSLLISLWAIWVRIFSDQAVPGWASSVLPMYLLGGIQLLSLGIVGEYVAKIYMETKRRPRFFIEEIL